MDKNEFKYIQVHLRFLERACNGTGVHPYDIQSLWETRERLSRLTVSKLEKEKLNFHEVALVIAQLSELLSGSYHKDNE